MCALLVALWPASSGVICGMSLTVGDEASREYARHLEGLFTDSTRQATGTAPAAAIGIGLAFCTAALAAGLWAGRPLTRGIVRALLPPRLRTSLTALWTAEDLDPPR